MTKPIGATQKQLEVKEFGKEKFEGLKFEMGAKFGFSENTGKDFCILETDYQKLKSEEYKASQEASSDVMDFSKDTEEAVDEKDLPF